ncbi:MAG: hypothetical protein EPO08_09095 [Rhodospirillaceae bacterium]|nr:MAG: hypothetical protein EPO08_09095 [Rhodospirillaceae bacterium]
MSSERGLDPKIARFEFAPSLKTPLARALIDLGWRPPPHYMPSGTELPFMADTLLAPLAVHAHEVAEAVSDDYYADNPTVRNLLTQIDESLHSQLRNQQLFAVAQRDAVQDLFEIVPAEKWDNLKIDFNHGSARGADISYSHLSIYRKRGGAIKAAQRLTSIADAGEARPRQVPRLTVVREPAPQSSSTVIDIASARRPPRAGASPTTQRESSAGEQRVIGSAPNAGSLHNQEAARQRRQEIETTAQRLFELPKPLIPGKTIKWPAFIKRLLSDLGVHPNAPGYGDDTIQRIVRPLVERLSASQ